MTMPRRTRTRRLVALFSLVALLVAGCNLDRGGEAGPTPTSEGTLGTEAAADITPTDPALLAATPPQTVPGALNGGSATPTAFTLSPVPGSQMGQTAEDAAPSGGVAGLPPTPDSNQAGGFRIESNFDTPGGAWISGSDETVARGIEGGVYYVSVMSSEGLLWGYTLGPKTGDTPPRDVVIEADVRLSQGGGEVAYGFICRRTEGENYYALTLNNQGQARIARTDGNQITPLTDWLPAPSVRSPQETNRLRAGCVGDVLWLEVNGNLIAQAQDATWSAGDYGLYVMNNRGGLARAEYDNAVIVGR